MSRPVRIAVDTTVNISPDVRERLGIALLPIRITGLPIEIENSLKEGDYDRFYAFLNQNPRMRFGTQAGSVWEMREVLEKLINRFDCDIVSLVVSGRLSAVYENTLQAAQELARKYPNRIVVIGQQAFLSLSLLAKAAAEYAQEGHGLSEVLAFIEDKTDRSFVLGSLLDISRLRRSGRVPIPHSATVFLQPLLKTLKLLPVFMLEEDRPQMMRVVNRSQFERLVFSLIRERVGFQEPIGVTVGYTGSEVLAEAEKMRSVIASSKEFVFVKSVEIERAGPVIGVHAGSALVGVGVLGLGYSAITTPVLIKFFQEAQNEINTFRRLVNAINVFPVQDGDTGSNLLSPLIGVTEGIDPNLALPVALTQIVTRIARKGGGYSGGALAAYLLGFSEYVVREESGPTLSLKNLVGAFKSGTNRCYQYFGADAKEGTILSVMRMGVEAAANAFSQRPTFRNVLVNFYLAATDELLNPAVQDVDILREKGMVDAGGFGFTLLLWALLRTLGLAREERLLERYRLVLQEVRRQTAVGQRLIYRRQPRELRGFCVEGCVRGEVAEELRQAFLSLDNRLPNPKMTFNMVDGTTHFHIHVSEGLEGEVQRIAARFGYALPPKPPTRLAKRRHEIYQFRFTNIFSWLRRVPGYIISFFANWVAYALFFPVMWFRTHHREKAIRYEMARLNLIRLAFSALVRDSETEVLILDEKGEVLFPTDFHLPGNRRSVIFLETFFPNEIVRELRTKLEEMKKTRLVSCRCQIGDFGFEIQTLSATGLNGFLVRYDGRRRTADGRRK